MKLDLQQSIKNRPSSCTWSFWHPGTAYWRHLCNNCNYLVRYLPTEPSEGAIMLFDMTSIGKMVQRVWMTKTVVTGFMERTLWINNGVFIRRNWYMGVTWWWWFLCSWRNLERNSTNILDGIFWVIPGRKDILSERALKNLQCVFRWNFSKKSSVFLKKSSYLDSPSGALKWIR